MIKEGGWKTKAAAICGMVYALVAIMVYYIGEPGVAWSLPPSEAIQVFLAGFAVFGGRDAIAKLTKVIGK